MRRILALASCTIACTTATAAEQAAPAEILQEIVVTAQRRAQNVQDVPIAISAISGDALLQAGIRDPRDLSLLVPNLTFQAGTAATTTALFIRGVGIGDFNSNTTGAVGVYVDDVFLGANAGKLFNVFDSEGIEVLKGPQGTLYGRNTTAGAIRFSSRKPTDELRIDASALYGRFDEVQIEGGIGGPLVADTLKARISGIYNQRDGTTKNRVTGHDVNDVDMSAVRAIVDFTPTDSLLLRATVHAGWNRGGARQFQHRGQGLDFAGNPAFSPSGRPLDAFGYADEDNDIYAGDYDIEGEERVDVFGGSLNAQLTLDSVDLVSITAYEGVDRYTLEDTDASPNDVITARYIDQPRQFSQELRVQSNTDERLSWILGGFYFDDELKTDSSYDILRVLRDPTAPFGGFDPVIGIGDLHFPYTQKTESFAVFGQSDYKLSERLTATTGLRYSRDRIDLDYSSFYDEPGLVFPILDFQGQKTFTDVSWRGALSYRSEDVLYYGSVSKGYNSGGFAGGASSDIRQLQPFDSEQLIAYEIGLKSELLDRTLRFNLGAFYYDYQDLQVFVFDTSGLIPLQRKLNAGNAEIYGLESDITVRLMDGLDVFLAASLLHTEYTEFTGLATADYTGNRLVSAPQFAASGGITYTIPLEPAGSIRARLDGSYQSKIYLTPDNAPSSRVGAYGVLNLRVAWVSDDDRYEVALWGKNITQREYVSFVAPIITQDELNYNDPYTFGLQFGYHWK